jgi:hypothetical protein
MSLHDVLQNAESEAAQLLEALRQQVVLRIISAHTLKGPGGQGLRSQVVTAIKLKLQNASVGFHDNLQKAWDAGIQRADEGKEYTHTVLMREVGPYQEAIQRSFEAMATALAERVNNILLRAAVNDEWDKEKVIKLIGGSANQGVFEEYTNRANGIVDYGCQGCEATAFAKRSREIQRVLAQMHPVKKHEKGPKLKVLMMKVWDHSDGGNPPRANHVAFHGKGVPVDMLFILPGRDGNKYPCEGPHDILRLPVGEIANCHCTEITVSIDVTDEQEESIRKEATATGGYRDERWQMKKLNLNVKK